jgi:hypothetical protein
MRQYSRWTLTLALLGGLSTGAWAQHGGGGHSGAHGPDLATNSGPHSSSAPSSHDAVGGNFATRLSNNAALASRLQPLLPPGTTLQAAAAGFKNRGQFIAALHVSHNLKIPFDQLKSEMTGSDQDSLGEAIHELRPDLTSKLVKNNVKLAENQTKTDIEVSEPSETAGK